MGLHGQQSPLLLPLLVLVTCVQPGTNLESINYIPQLSSDTLDGRLTQSTFALEQPMGQFENVSLSDWDPIWLVVAHSNATQSFAAPQKVEDMHAPANFDRNGYYLTMRTSRVYYKASQPDSQLRVLRVLRVGNDNSCSLTSQGCNAPLPRAGPYRSQLLLGTAAALLSYQSPAPTPSCSSQRTGFHAPRVKFLAMSAKGPVAETKWSEEISLQQAQTFHGAPGSRSKGAVVIIAFSLILLAILLAVFLVLVISAYCWGTAVSSPEEQVHMKRYHTHHHGDSLRAERSS